MENIWLHEKNYNKTYVTDYERDRINRSKFTIRDVSKITKREFTTKTFDFLQIFQKNPVSIISECPKKYIHNNREFYELPKEKNNNLKDQSLIE